MQYCINALLKNNNKIMQYYIINNDIALIMHYCALLQMPECIQLRVRFPKEKMCKFFRENNIFHAAGSKLNIF